MTSNENDDIAERRFHIYRHLKQLIHGMDSHRDDAARKFGLTGASLYLLVSIDKVPQCSYKDLAAYTGLAPNTVSAVVSSLISQQIVSAEQDCQDRRIIRLTLTDIGRRIAKDAYKLMRTGADVNDEAICIQWVLEELDEIQNLCR
ncbi:hypothetical protein JZ785_13590 [Alicyclobacillus curvatus]|jgi:DNA-binding MarR family transcriptional regulator|nr:hypothetical protein JZ785_13590 [Alicyclobacillus curvatus]